MKQHSLSSFERKIMVVVILVATTSAIVTDIYIPSLPQIKVDFATTDARVQLTLSIYLLFVALSSLFYGPLSDKIGRKKVTILGILIGLAGTLFAYFSWDIASLLVARAIQGVGLGSLTFIFRIILRDLFSGDRMAYYSSFISISRSAMFAMAPFLGGLIEHYLNWRISFLFLFLYLAATMMFILYWLKETNPNLNPKALHPKVILKNYLHLTTNPIFLGYSICSAATYASSSAFLAETPFLLITVVGISPLQYGALTIVPAIVLCIGGYSNGFLLKKIGRHRTLVIGMWILLTGAFLLLILYFLGFLNVLSILIPMTLSYLATALISANAGAGALTPFTCIAGSAGALLSTFRIVGGFLGVALISFSQKTTQLPLGIVILLLAIIGYVAQKVAFLHALKHPHPH